MIDVNSFAAVEVYLNRLQMFGIKLGLTHIRTLLTALDGAADRLRFIHLAGSNGKGSTGAMLQAMLRAAGLRVGFYTSPHLISPRERIRIDGRALSEAQWCAAFARVLPAAQRLEAAGETPTYFEFHTAMAVAAFDTAQVDFVVWETGMGGRLDATNAIEQPEAAVITGIALEHQQYLGHTLAEIAAEKAGILKPGCPVFAGAMPPEALAVIRQRAAELGCAMTAVEAAGVPEVVRLTADGQWLRWEGHEFKLALRGVMQRRNAALALAVMREVAARCGVELARALPGLATVKWPARLQELPDGTWLDGGHNPDGVAALLEALAERFPGRRFRFIFGAFADKEVDRELELLSRVAAEIWFVPLKGGLRPSVAPEELVRRWSACSAVPAQAAVDAAAALAQCPGGNRVICGSLFLAGEVLELLLGADAALDI